MPAHKIIVGVDGSEHSARAVMWCANHAQGLDAEVIAVHVVEQPIYAGSIYPLVPPITFDAEQRGTVTVDIWFATSNGLPLREEHTITVVSPAPAPLNRVTYKEIGTWELTSLQPRT